MDVVNLTAVVTSQYICIPKHAAHLKLTQHYMPIISQKSWKKDSYHMPRNCKKYLTDVSVKPCCNCCGINFLRNTAAECLGTQALKRDHLCSQFSLQVISSETRSKSPSLCLCLLICKMGILAPISLGFVLFEFKGLTHIKSS